MNECEEENKLQKDRLNKMLDELRGADGKLPDDFHIHRNRIFVDKNGEVQIEYCHDEEEIVPLEETIEAGKAAIIKIYEMQGL